jgi:uncharacterized membrane protein YeaQ/YmgE (transglycosylase-associated protein family)
MSILPFLLSVLIAFVIGSVAEKLSPYEMPGGFAGAIVAGFVGAWIGPVLFGRVGPMVAGFALVPSIIGAIIFVIIVGILAHLF